MWGEELLAFLGQFLPAVGEELVDAGVGVRGNTREEVAQVGKGIDAMPFGALDKTVEGGGGGTPAAAAREKPVVASDLRIPVNPNPPYRRSFPDDVSMDQAGEKRKMAFAGRLLLAKYYGFLVFVIYQARGEILIKNLGSIPILASSLESVGAGGNRDCLSP